MGEVEIVNEFKVYALGPAGPLRIPPVKAKTSGEAWSIAEKCVREVQEQLGSSCKLLSVVWCEPGHSQAIAGNTKFKLTK